MDDSGEGDSKEFPSYYLEDYRSRQVFLVRYLWICDKLLLAVQRYRTVLPKEGFAF